MLQKKGIQILVFVLIAGLMITSCTDSGTVQPDEDHFVYRESKTTYVYKQVGDLKIKADVLQVQNDVARPVVVWLHGGALYGGGREAIPKNTQGDLLAAGYDIITIDYRLAPETKLPEIFADLEDFFEWLHKVGPSELDIDTSRIAVMGASAGGYLALLAGYRISPRPTAVISQWGFGGLLSRWQLEPSTNPRHNRPRDKMSEEDFLAVLKQPPVSNSSQRAKSIWIFFNVSKQRGLGLRMLTGWDPHKEPEKFHPYIPLKHFTSDYPPTLLIHGTEDSDVPHEQSELMEQELKKHNVPYEFFSVEGAEHSLAGASWDQIRRSQELLIEFLDKYMKE